MFFEACGDSSKMLELVEEALDEVAISKQEGAEGGNAHAARHGFDVGPGAAAFHLCAQSVAVIGSIRQKDLATGDVGQHVGGALTVMGLAGRELEEDGQAIGVDQGVDLGRQPASRAPHALASREVPSGGLRAPFLTLEAC